MEARSNRTQTGSFETLGEAAQRLLAKLDARVNGRPAVERTAEILICSTVILVVEPWPGAERYGEEALHALGHSFESGCVGFAPAFVRRFSSTNGKAATHPHSDDAVPADRASREGSTLRVIWEE